MFNLINATRFDRCQLYFARALRAFNINMVISAVHICIITAFSLVPIKDLICSSCFISLKNLCKAFHKFFRESKQYLNLGKSRSTCFDAQIADATISLSQYIILSFHRRILDYSSFDGIFASAIEDALQNSIACELQKMFWVILEIYSDFTGVDIIEVTRSIFRDEQACNKIRLHNPVFFKNLKENQAA